MFIFKILGIFGFFTGPIIMAVIGAIGMVKVTDLIRNLIGFGESGPVVEVARGGIFVGTTATVTAIAARAKVFSKLEGVRRIANTLTDGVDPKQK